MSDRATIMAAVPLRNRAVMLESNQSVRDIMRAITYYHKKYAKQYDSFADQFDIGDERAIAKALFRFCKKNIDYVIEDEERQTVRSPARIMAENAGDCKHYASFIAGVLDSLRRSGLDLEWAYRFAKYEDAWTGKINNHVFVVLWDRNGKEIWIDPVLNWFDYHLPYKSAITKTIDTLPKGSQMGCPGSDCSCSRVGATGDTYLPVPPGYPTNIPRPVLTTDHKLMLRDNYHLLNDTEVAWVQQALQPLIIQYAPKPYSIYWSIPNWGSGKAHVIAAAAGGILGVFGKNEDFLKYPSMPSGFDNFMTSVSQIVPSLLGLGANAVVPGSGGVVAAAVANDIGTSSGGNSPVDLSSAQLQAYQQQTQSQASILPTGSSGSILSWLLIGVGIYFVTKK